MVSRGLIGLARKQFTYQSKPLMDTSSYWKGCIRIAPSLLHYYCPMARDTHPMFGLSLGFLPMLTTTQAPWNFWHRSYHVLTNLDRCMDVAGLFKTLELNRPLSSNSFFFFRQKQPLLFSLLLLSSSSLFFFFFFSPFLFISCVILQLIVKNLSLGSFSLKWLQISLGSFSKNRLDTYSFIPCKFQKCFQKRLKTMKYNLQHNKIYIYTHLILQYQEKTIEKKLRLHTVISKR